jgi:hypothetical protein
VIVLLVGCVGVVGGVIGTLAYVASDAIVKRRR